jgi:tetratricopeptide (TPR) repeat protein
MLPPLVVVAEEAAPADLGRQEAKMLFEEAQTLYTKEKFEEAATKFLLAYEKKPFGSFVFNAAVAYEKANKLDKALDAFRRYLILDPQASDAAEVKIRIEGLKALLAPPPTVPLEGQPVSEKPTAPALPSIETKGLVIIDTKPAGATIYLDDKSKGGFATSPWQGSLPPKPVKVLVEARGFKSEARQILPRVDKVVELYVALSEQHFLGWVELISNVPGAEVFIDRREIGAIGKTPYTGYLKPGKHTIWIQKHGYELNQQEISVEPGTATTHTMNLERVNFGMMRAGSKSSEGAQLFIDGAWACTMPCEQKLAPGEHTLHVKKEGMENFEGKVKVDQADEIAMDMAFSPKPSRVKAWTQAAFATGFLIGGIYLGIEGKKIKDALEKDSIDPGKSIRTDDSRKARGKIYYISADVCFAAAAVTGLLSLWHFLESGPASVGILKTSNSTKAPEARLGFAPVAVPGGAGVAAMGRF